MLKRNVCVVTGTRAEYGLLTWILREIEADPELNLQLAVTGMHLAPEFGMTVQDIEADGFTVDARVEMLVSSDTPVGVAKSIGLGVIGFADALARLQPDVLLVIGDRFETLAAAQAALVARLPIAHLHGGETTEGAIDEAIRHSITKMAHLHFVAAEPYRRRVVQLGEDPARVFTVGSPGLDHVHRTPRMTRAEVEELLGFQIEAPTFVVTFHPETLSSRSVADSVGELFRALLHFRDARFVLTKSNADSGGRAINEAIDAFVEDRRDRACAFTAMGLPRYLSTLAFADVVIGNSSSGLMEAPALGVPTVNVGDRQKGRLRAASVIDCDGSESEIVQAIETALSPEFRAQIEGQVMPYGVGDASPVVSRLLRETPLGDDLLRKQFYDFPRSAFELSH